MKISFALLSFGLLTFSQFSKAQPVYGNDSIKCHEHLHIYNNEYQMGARAEVFESWKIVYDECPASSKNNFILGSQIIKAKIKIEKSDSLKSQLITLLIELYDRRLEHFPERENYVKSLQAQDILKYEVEPILETYKRFKKLNGIGNIQRSPSFYNAYLLAATKSYKAKGINKLELFEAYNEIIDGIDFNNHQLNQDIQKIAAKIKTETIGIEEERNLEKLNRQLNIYDKVELNAEKIFARVADCTWLLKIYNEESFQKNKNEPEWINRASRALMKNHGDNVGHKKDCSDNPIFLKVVESQVKNQPSSQSYRALAKLTLSQNEVDKALKSYLKALEMELDPKKQALDYYNIAVLQIKLNRLPEAKVSSLKAAGLKSNWGEPYILLAQIYAMADGLCGTNVYENKAVYWAAIDMLELAKKIDPSVQKKADAQISNYKKNLPDIGVCHMMKKKEGDEYEIGCWINETITTRFYKS